MAQKHNFVHQLVLPESLRGLALNQLHDQASSGHLGLRHTLAQMYSRFYWVGCKSHVIVWCQVVRFVKEKTCTTPYHPQRDGLIERFNGTLEDMLSKVVEQIIRIGMIIYH